MLQLAGVEESRLSRLAIFRSAIDRRDRSFGRGIMATKNPPDRGT